MSRPQVFKEKELRVRKTQACAQCHRAIKPGDYAYLQVFKEKTINTKDSKFKLKSIFYNEYSCNWCLR